MVVPIETAAFEHGARRTRVSLGSEPLVVVSRRDFDSSLLAAASRAGAHLIPARATDVAPHPRRLGRRHARRRAVCGVAARRGRPEQPRETTRAAAVRSRQSVDRDGVLRPRPDIARDRHRLQRAAGRVPLGVSAARSPRGRRLAQADESSSAALLSSASRWIAGNVEGPVETVRYSWPIPSLRVATLQREQPAGPRWMLLGDAGGMVDPITREGDLLRVAVG